MGKAGWLAAKAKSKLKKSNDPIVDYLRKAGVSIGNNTHVFSDLSEHEPYLITIGDGVTISVGVVFVTHDASVSKVIPEATDVFGEIHVGNNVFIGLNSVILPGVSIADDVIVAAGSVITKSITEPGAIVGGNPAKVIGKASNLKEKYLPYAVNLKEAKGHKRDFILMAPKLEK